MRIDNILQRLKPGTVRFIAIAATTLLIILQVAPVLAQLEDELGIYTPSIGSQFRRYAMLGIAVFVLFIIFVIIKRRMGSTEKFEPILGMTISDVGELKQKGLLTEEESKAVRAAVARQLSKQLDTRKTASTRGGAESLLADPEIRRLEALAQKKAAAAKAESCESRFRNLESTPAAEASLTAAPATSSELQEIHPLDAQPYFSPAVDVLDEISSRPLDEKASASSELPQAAPEQPASAASADDDVQLPQDVLTMAQLGLITPEELENIKARARAKKRELGS